MTDRIRRTYAPPPDKAITHRALILAAVAEGTTRVTRPSVCGDTLATAACLKKMGARIKFSKNLAVIKGLGLRGLRRPRGPLNAGGSGTTMRLLAGLLAGQEFDSVLTGKGSLLKRPMARVTSPLAAMGADITRRCGRAPLRIRGRRLTGKNHKLSIPSAQVKSAILLAGLYAKGPTSVAERLRTRDHTERLLEYFGGRVSARGGGIRLRPGPLRARTVKVPGDLSSAAPFMVAASLLPGFRLTVKSVGLNPGRTGLIRALKAMGAKITVKRTAGGPEPAGRIIVRGSALSGVRVRPGDVPSMIDELPLLALASAFARGTTVISGAGELKHKESDRLKAVFKMFKALGLRAAGGKDRLIIKGPQRIRGRGPVETFGDHRIAMAAAVASLLAPAPVKIKNRNCVNKSYPGFFSSFKKIFPR